MIRYIGQGVLITLLALGLSGCNTANPDAPAVNAVHPETWVIEHDAEVAVAGVEGCKICHGEDLAGSGHADACLDCHSTSPVANSTGCASCHGTPPNVGAHGTHNALAGVQDACDTCHDGLGADTERHVDDASIPRAEVAIAATYDAKSGMAAYDYNSQTCSDVSCHGGQDTPDMLTGTLNVNTACTSCHAYGTTQYNSFNSGRHSTHAGSGGYWGGACTNCHNTTTLAVDHFSALDTQAIEGDAGLTIGGTAITTYNATTYECLPVCHVERRWQIP